MSRKPPIQRQRHHALTIHPPRGGALHPRRLGRFHHLHVHLEVLVAAERAAGVAGAVLGRQRVGEEGVLPVHAWVRRDGVEEHVVVVEAVFGAAGARHAWVGAWGAVLCQ